MLPGAKNAALAAALLLHLHDDCQVAVTRKAKRIMAHFLILECCTIACYVLFSDKYV